jgi:hypothetical protein
VGSLIRVQIPVLLAFEQFMPFLFKTASQILSTAPFLNFLILICGVVGKARLRLAATTAAVSFSIYKNFFKGYLQYGKTYQLYLSGRTFDC